MPIESVGASAGTTGTRPVERNERTSTDRVEQQRESRREPPPDRGRTESRNSYGDRAETSRGY